MSRRSYCGEDISHWYYEELSDDSTDTESDHDNHNVVPPTPEKRLSTSTTIFTKKSLRDRTFLVYIEIFYLFIQN